ncbi:MAG: hypothetical protein ACXVCS_08700 [Bdellovibrionota bacterium]
MKLSIFVLGACGMFLANLSFASSCMSAGGRTEGDAHCPEFATQASCESHECKWAGAVQKADGTCELNYSVEDDAVSGEVNLEFALARKSYSKNVAGVRIRVVYNRKELDTRAYTVMVTHPNGTESGGAVGLKSNTGFTAGSELTCKTGESREGNGEGAAE